MHKMMVMSATYRQTSNIAPENLQKDPRNFLLERGPRFRLPAETIRDTVLMASGLLVKKVGGDAVFPYAPDASWDRGAQAHAVETTNVPAEQNSRRSLSAFVERNAPAGNLGPRGLPDPGVRKGGAPTPDCP